MPVPTIAGSCSEAGRPKIVAVSCQDALRQRDASQKSRAHPGRLATQKSSANRGNSFFEQINSPARDSGEHPANALWRPRTPFLSSIPAFASSLCLGRFMFTADQSPLLARSLTHPGPARHGRRAPSAQRASLLARVAPGHPSRSSVMKPPPSRWPLSSGRQTASLQPGINQTVTNH